MMQNVPSTPGARLSAVISSLKNLKKIPSQGYLAQQLGYKSEGTITEMKADRSDVSDELIAFLQKNYRVNSEYIIEGKGTMFLDSTTTEVGQGQTFDLLLEKINSLERELEKKGNINQDLSEIKQALSDLQHNLRVSTAIQIEFQDFYLTQLYPDNPGKVAQIKADMGARALASAELFRLQGIQFSS